MRNIDVSLGSVILWFQANKLSVNLDKTNYMVFCMRNKKNINFDNIQITIQGCNIERVSKVKFLGVWLDEQLNWKSHIAYVSSKVSKATSNHCESMI